MSLRRKRGLTPFAARGRRTVVAVLATIALVSAITVILSIRETSHAQHQAAVVEVAARQRTLAERYLSEVLLARSGARADPGYTASLLHRSARALLEGGVAPAVNGDDDETDLSAPTDPVTEAQLEQAERLGNDLTATGAALLVGRPLSDVPQTAGEHMQGLGSLDRLRSLTVLSSNVSLNAARTIAANADRTISGLVTTQIVLGGVGLLISLLLGLALIAATRRQSAHFRSLVSSSTDLVLLFGEGGCQYASESVASLTGRDDDELLGDGFIGLVHPQDADLVGQCAAVGDPTEIVMRVMNRFGEWRDLEARVTDLRSDRHLRGVLFNARDVSERIRLEGELTQQAFHDGLTGLANRALFRDRLDQALARSIRSHGQVAVLLLDLDGFKQVNDSLGHDAGDALLGEVARRFSETARPSDTLARLGGDEFALLLEGADEEEAQVVAGRLREQLTQPFSITDRDLAITASIGVAVASPADSDAEDLLRDADIAMYAAKEAGRDRSEVFHRDMAREFGELLGLEHELRLGLEGGEVSVHYQPEVTLDGEIVGVEALMRWHSGTRGNVPPMRFIPLAERTGMIFELGEFVLAEACAQTKSWADKGVLPERFTTWVNLSGKQLSAGGLSDIVKAALEDSGLPPEHLGLEVTETAIAEGAAGDRAKEGLEELHALGVRIAIDDFGTGFSALGRLRHFPIDMLKVDRSFVRGIEDDPKDAAITANLVSLAHTMGILAIAEGIETAGQLAAIRSIGCDLAQGYLFGRPVEAGLLTELLIESRGSPAVAGTAPRPLG
jgi:diguanylate cyclase (GGDEF)-like protein/PAS domain S-box-containing protein